jgi:citrate lyase subunit beta/citryl-CoA lyase
MRPIPRSFLFVPGNRPDRFVKALNSGPHSVIIDLEDGVAPKDKEGARRSVAEWLNPAHPVVLRINGAETEWFDDDVSLCGRPGVTAVMIPKVETVQHVLDAARHSPQGLPILPQIESARGFAAAREIAGCAGVERLIFGPLDFQVDLGIAGDGEELLFFRSNLVLVSRLAGVLPPVDGPTTAIDDPDLLRADTERARRLGFGGKLCIHPKQVSVVHECLPA